LELHPCGSHRGAPAPRVLSRFLVQRVRPARRAELLDLHPIRLLAPVARGVVVPPLAVVARQGHVVTHVISFLPPPPPSPRPGATGRAGGYSMISVTTPAPTVRPPSRMAKRSSFSMAIGWPSSTEIVTLSPGITISRPSGNFAAPVTSVVRK